ncbi:MAG: aldehyde ferredoxin oxidoreductase family protein [bacterium]
MSCENHVCGWTGKSLWVDLSRGTLASEPSGQELRQGYLGGAGMAARLLYDLNPPSIQPLDEQAPLIFSTGPLVGERFPGASRLSAVARSPLTGIYGDSSSGSRFSMAMKWAGYDLIVIQGKAQRPCLLVIDQNERPRIESADDVWGMDCFETDEVLQKRFGSCEVARIGPAGENGVRYASIVAGHRRFGVHGRMGMGAKMGAKRLKAIVVRATPRSFCAQPEKLGQAARHFSRLMASVPTNEPIRKYGTLHIIASSTASLGGLYGRNARDFLPLFELDPLSPELFEDKYKTGQTGCPYCPVACTMRWKAKDPEADGREMAGLKAEFGQALNLGPNLGIFDLPFVLRLSHLSNRLGIDAAEFGRVAGLVMECMERGLIKETDTDGLTLRWGNARAVEALMLKTALGQGFGALASLGVRRLGEILNVDGRYAFHIKGAAMDAISNIPWTLSFCTSPRGGDHLKALAFFSFGVSQTGPQKIWGEAAEQATDPLSHEGNGRLIWWHENFKMLHDCLGLCVNATQGISMLGEEMLVQDLARLYTLSTGIETDAQEIMTGAERCFQIERAFNARLGISRKHDSFIRRDVKNDPLCQPDPQFADIAPVHPHLAIDLDHPGMLDEYYQYRGCSSNGLPTKMRLAEVGLSEVIDDLQKYQAIAEDDVIPLKTITRHQP